MPKFKIRFELDAEPGQIVAEFIVEAPWEAEAIEQATALFAEHFPEDAKKPYTSGSQNT